MKKLLLFSMLLCAAVVFASCKKDKPTGVAVGGVTVGKTSASVVVGKTETLTFTITPENASNKAVIWSSSDPTVATVSDKGVVTGVKAGTATITVKTADGGKTATCKVSITDGVVPVTGVKFGKTETSIETGKTETLQVVFEPENATNQNVTWSSSDETIAKVDDKGVITGVKAGTATISVKTEDGEKTASCKVTVPVTNVTDVTLNKTETTIAFSRTETLIATVAPENAANKTVTWSSDNETIATVDDKGVVTGVNLGTANITVKTVDGEKTATCKVTVTPNVTLGAEKMLLVLNDKEKLVVTVMPANTPNKNVIWSSSNEGVATVDADGNVTAVANGDAIITATAEDGAATATCPVTVQTPLVDFDSEKWTTAPPFFNPLTQNNAYVRYEFNPDREKNKYYYWMGTNAPTSGVASLVHNQNLSASSLKIKLTVSINTPKSLSLGYLTDLTDLGTYQKVIGFEQYPNDQDFLILVFENVQIPTNGFFTFYYAPKASWTNFMFYKLQIFEQK